jgi:hypothetical protein
MGFSSNPMSVTTGTPDKPGPRDSAWDDGYQALLAYAYVAEHGTARVPRAYRTADGYRLGGWVTAQRKTYTSGDLDPERITQLEAVKGWAWVLTATPVDVGGRNGTNKGLVL